MTIIPVRGRPQYAKENFFRSLQRKWAMKIGRIEDLLISPCHQPLGPGTPVDALIWVTAFFAGIPEAVFTINKHDCSDNLWDKNKQVWAPHKPGRGGRHGRRGTPERQATGSFPGLGKQANGWQTQIFNIGNLLEKIGAGLMVIDAALDLAINWQSNYLNWNGCGAPPPVFTTASVARDVVGCGAGELRNDLAGHPGSVGIMCGIGGFITTVPVGQLEFAGNVPDRQFLWTSYQPLRGTYWEVDKKGGETSAPKLDQKDGSAPTPDGIGMVHSSRASMHTLGATGRSGSIIIEAPSGSGFCGCQVDPGNIVTIMGESSGLLTNDPKPDPCSNLPLSGTAVRGR